MSRRKAVSKEELGQRALEATTQEVQLLQRPFFCISPVEPSDTRAEYSEIVRIEGHAITRVWVVRIHSDFGWPGELEADIWRAIEHIMHLQREAGILKNPVETSLSEIRRYMPSKWQGGHDLSLIVKGIKCLIHSKVDTNWWYDGREKIIIDGEDTTFSLIQDWTTHKRRLPDGKEVITRVLLIIHPVVFANIAAGYVRPLDRGYRDSLARWIAKRLYELLGVKFYALRDQKSLYRIKYSRLCAILGIKRQRYLSNARQILGRAHRELEEKGFLAKVEWYPCLSDRSDWVLCYWPGEAAKAEWHKDYWRRAKVPTSPLFVEEIPETKPEPVWVDELQADESNIDGDLVSDDLASAEDVVETSCELVSSAKERRDARADDEHRSAADTTAKHRGRPRKVPQGDGEIKAPVPPAAPVEDDLPERVVIETFERVTGRRRRCHRLSAAERNLLVELRVVGATIEDIEVGVNAALQRESAISEKARRAPREIWSLDYCGSDIYGAIEKREELIKQQREEERAAAQASGAEAERARVFREELTRWPVRLNDAPLPAAIRETIAKRFAEMVTSPDVTPFALDAAAMQIFDREVDLALLEHSHKELLDQATAQADQALAKYRGRMSAEGLRESQRALAADALRKKMRLPRLMALCLAAMGESWC